MARVSSSSKSSASRASTRASCAGSALGASAGAPAFSREASIASRSASSGSMAAGIQANRLVGDNRAPRWRRRTARGRLLAPATCRRRTRLAVALAQSLKPPFASALHPFAPGAAGSAPKPLSPYGRRAQSRSHFAPAGPGGARGRNAALSAFRRLQARVALPPAPEQAHIYPSLQALLKRSASRAKRKNREAGTGCCESRWPRCAVRGDQGLCLEGCAKHLQPVWPECRLLPADCEHAQTSRQLVDCSDRPKPARPSRAEPPASPGRRRRFKRSIG